MDTLPKKKVVLIVEDESVLRAALQERLLKEGFAVFMASDGEEGLLLTLREHPDLVLLDILMPNMNGIEMTKQLRKDPWGSTAKVIVLTNVTELSHISDALDEKIFDYLIKSNTPLDEVVERIREMTGIPTGTVTG